MCSKELQEESNEFVLSFGPLEFCILWSRVVPYIHVKPPAKVICHMYWDNATRILHFTEDKKSKNFIEA